MRVIPNWTVTYDPSDYTTQNRSLGLLLKYRRDLGVLHARLTLGADVDWSPGSQLEKQTAVSRAAGTPVYAMSYTGVTLYDYDVTYHGVAEYAQIDLSPVAPLHLSFGLRADQSGYDYSNHLGPLDSGRWKRPASLNVSPRAEAQAARRPEC